MVYLYYVSHDWQTCIGINQISCTFDKRKKKTPKKPDIHGFVLNASLHIVKLRLGFEASTASFSFFLHRSDKMVLLKEHLNRTFVIAAEESDESVKMSKKQIVRRKHLT